MSVQRCAAGVAGFLLSQSASSEFTGRLVSSRAALTTIYLRTIAVPLAAALVRWALLKPANTSPVQRNWIRYFSVAPALIYILFSFPAFALEVPFRVWYVSRVDCLGVVDIYSPSKEAPAEQVCSWMLERDPVCSGSPALLGPPHTNGLQNGTLYTFKCTPAKTGVNSGTYAVEYSISPSTARPKDFGRTCDDCVGNPIQIGTGNKFEELAIYQGFGPFPLEVRLFYNSNGDGEPKAFGRNWRLNFERSIRVDAAASSFAMAWREDGKVFGFRLIGTSWQPDSDVADVLVPLTDQSGNRTGWKYTDSRTDSTETYDSTGRLISISSRSGLAQTLTYSDSNTPPSVAPRPGLLISIADSFGRSASFVYNSAARVVSMTDPSGISYSFTYNAQGNLSTIGFPGAVTREFLYNEQTHTGGAHLPLALTGIVDENASRYATFTYDDRGRAISSEHGVGVGKVTNSYGWTTPAFNTGSSYTTTTTDAFGLTRTQTFTSMFRKTRVTSISGVCAACGMRAAAQTYDANGNVASRTDWNGNRTNYAYDLVRNLQTSRTEGLTTSGGTTPQTRTITTAWHPTYRLPTQVAEPLRLTTNVYDADGSQCGARGALCSRTVQATTDGNGSQGLSVSIIGAARVWSYTYNANGSVLTANGPRTDVSDVTTYTYYPDDDSDVGKRGNVASITNAAGHRTDITAYNGHGQPLTMVDANGLTTTLTYDPRQRLKTRTVGSENTTYDYDDAGQLTKVTLPDGSFLSYDYDPAHRLTSITDNQGNRIAYTLDAMGNRTVEEVFDPASQLAQKRSRVYSNLNRLFQELGAQNQTTEYGYDDQGNVTSVKDPLTHITSSQYDALNRLKQVTDPALGVTQYAYNGLDALTQMTDPRTLVTGYTVDGLGNLTLQSSPDTGNTTSTHDVAGNLLTETDAKGQVTTYAYDALNRVTLITFHGGSKQIYAYDQGANAIGRLSSITETDPANQQTSLVQYGYSPQGRVTSETRTVGGVQYVAGYSYDISGRLSGITYPSGRTLTYSFDALGRVSGISTTFSGQTQPVVSAVTYHPFGGVKSYTLGNGQAYSRSYDQDGRIGSYTLGSKTFSIGYDAASRIEFINEFGNPSNSNTYGYDELDRLTSAVTPGTPYGYTYDAVGNRRTKTAGAATETIDYSTTSNRIATLTPATRPQRTFVFDPNGSTTNDGVNTYTYDVRGRMVQATSGLGTTSYQVNALGQRIRKTNSQGDTVFHYDIRGRLIAETTPAGALKRELIYLGDMPVGVVQ